MAPFYVYVAIVKICNLDQVKTHKKPDNNEKTVESEVSQNKDQRKKKLQEAMSITICVILAANALIMIFAIVLIFA